uniref:Uncharacterized protein n=1 Tax=Rhizophora mucronata TaxID=61149 RepID=A0A2P2QSA1_RHIMU
MVKNMHKHLHLANHMFASELIVAMLLLCLLCFIH